MSFVTDKQFLKTQQYKSGSNLNARIQLHQQFSTNKYDWPKWVFDHFLVAKSAHFLDLGCGTGYLWQQNIDRIADDWAITLSDFSAGMVQQAAASLGDKSNKFYFRMADAQHLPWADESFEVVIANHMLYHVPDRSRAFSEIKRVLKPEGKLYAATNGQHHIIELTQLIQEIDPDAREEDHVDEFGLENGREQLSHYFPEINLYVYKDSLQVTEVEPLLAYIQSTQ
ncbi:MAG: class I SAM-dependent methyltransferase, partial [Chloroflexota bacterium]